MSKKETMPENTAVKMPFFKSILGAYGLLLDKFKEFVSAGCLFSLILAVLYFSFGQDVLCTNGDYRKNHLCTDSLYLYIVIHFVALFIVAMYMRCFSLTALCRPDKLSLRSFIPCKKDIKIFCLFCLFLTGILIAGLSAYLLYIRIPNPDWKIEIGYFMVVSLGFWVPIISLRFLSLFAFAACGEPLPSIKTLWQKTSGNMANILVGIMLLVIFLSTIGISLTNNILRLQSESLLLALGYEYLSDFAVILAATCFINFCYIQKNILFERDNNV